MSQEELDLVEDDQKPLVSIASFKKNYSKILGELDTVSRGVFDESEAEQYAALCLLAQAGLIKALASAEQRARGLKRDVEFAKASAYAKLKDKPVEGKKPSETALGQFVLMDDEVISLQNQQNVAERESKELNNILGMLKDAHLTFRAVIKKN